MRLSLNLRAGCFHYFCCSIFLLLVLLLVPAPLLFSFTYVYFVWQNIYWFIWMWCFWSGYSYELRLIQFLPLWSHLYSSCGLYVIDSDAYKIKWRPFFVSLFIASTINWASTLCCDARCTNCLDVQKKTLRFRLLNHKHKLKRDTKRERKNRTHSCHSIEIAWPASVRMLKRFQCYLIDAKSSNIIFVALSLSLCVLLAWERCHTPYTILALFTFINSQMAWMHWKYHTAMVNITDDMDKVMHASDRRYQSDFFFVCDDKSVAAFVHFTCEIWNHQRVESRFIGHTGIGFKCSQPKWNFPGKFDCTSNVCTKIRTALVYFYYLCGDLNVSLKLNIVFELHPFATRSATEKKTTRSKLLSRHQIHSAICAICVYSSKIKNVQNGWTKRTSCKKMSKENGKLEKVKTDEKEGEMKSERKKTLFSFVAFFDDDNEFKQVLNDVTK